jgi:alpha-glucuronidase
VDPLRYQAVLDRLQYQAGHAIVWRDAIDTWFYRKSGIPDRLGRVGHDPHRIEAEAMQLQGYQPVAVHPFEAASGSRAVTCPAAANTCTASFHFSGQPGWYDVSVQYFDQNNGEAHFQLRLNGRPISAWTADNNLPSRRLDADTSTRHTVHGVALRRGDELEIQSTPQGGDSASVDYVTLHSSLP